MYGETEPMDMDHQPSFAAQKLFRETQTGRPLNKTQERELKRNTPAIASPRAIHRNSPTYGGNNKALIKGDSKDLTAAQARDLEAFNRSMGDR